MTEREFRRALKRHGFSVGAFGLWFTHEDRPSVSYGAIIHTRTGRVLRRETIANLIREYDKDAR